MLSLIPVYLVCCGGGYGCSGPDARVYLQNLCTNDISLLEAPGDTLYESKRCAHKPQPHLTHIQLVAPPLPDMLCSWIPRAAQSLMVTSPFHTMLQMRCEQPNNHTPRATVTASADPAFVKQSTLYIDMDSSVAPAALKHLKMRKLRKKVEFEELGDSGNAALVALSPQPSPHHTCTLCSWNLCDSGPGSTCSPVCG